MSRDYPSDYILHISLSNLTKTITPDRLREYIQLYPRSLHIEYKGEYPIHIAIRMKLNIDIIRILVESNVSCLFYRTSSGNLPIHLICQQDLKNYESIYYFATIYPRSLSIKSCEGFLPAHLAARTSQKSEILITIIDMYPECMNVKEPSGNTIMHLVCANEDMSIQAIQYLATRFPMNVRERNDNGYLPIHTACIAYRNVHGLGIIQALVDAYPESVGELSPKGSVLSLVIKNLKTKSNNMVNYIHDGIEYLIARSPSLANIVDNEGLPIHVACKYPMISLNGSDTNIKIIKALVEVYPESLLIPRVSDNRLPIHIACCEALNSSAQEVILYLANQCPKSLLQIGKCGNALTEILRNSNLNKNIDLISRISLLQPSSIYMKFSNNDDDDEFTSNIELVSNISNIAYRKLLNCHPQGLSSEQFIKYRNINWSERKPVILLMISLTNMKGSGFYFFTEQSILHMIGLGLSTKRMKSLLTPDACTKKRMNRKPNRNLIWNRNSREFSLFTEIVSYL